MRTAFIEQLIQEARTNPAVFLIVGDLGYSVVEPFATEFPDRFLNAGVAEQNMSGVAAGLASEGYHVFTYSIANFSTLRCFEQIRNDVAYHSLPVTVVAVGGGTAYGNLGYSHHAVQDMAVMRTLPGMLLACPGDVAEARSCINYLVEHPQPSYLRLGKSGGKIVHSKMLARFTPGDVVPVISPPGATKAVLTTGEVLDQAVTGANESNSAVYSLPLWGASCSREGVRAMISSYEQVVTVEEHLTHGGFGSFIRECVADSPKIASRIKSISLNDSVCGMVAKQATLMAAGGVSALTIAKALCTDSTDAH